jgi:transcriptional regulator with XRE-family HTH domain
MLSEAQKIAIRHLTPPPADRQLTKQALADLLGVTVRAIQKWEAGNAEFRAALEKSREAYKFDADWFDRIIRHQTLEAFVAGALMTPKSRDEWAHKRACMKELRLLTDHIADSGERVDMSAYTDKELLEMALQGDIDVLGFSRAELEGMLEDEAG